MTQEFQLGQEVQSTGRKIPYRGKVTASGEQSCCVLVEGDRYIWIANEKLTAVRRNWRGAAISGSDAK